MSEQKTAEKDEATKRPWTALTTEPFEGLVSGIVITAEDDKWVAVVLDGPEGTEQETLANAELVEEAVNVVSFLRDELERVKRERDELIRYTDRRATAAEAALETERKMAAKAEAGEWEIAKKLVAAEARERALEPKIKAAETLWRAAWEARALLLQYAERVRPKPSKRVLFARDALSIALKRVEKDFAAALTPPAAEGTTPEPKAQTCPKCGDHIDPTGVDGLFWDGDETDCLCGAHLLVTVGPGFNTEENVVTISEVEPEPDEAMATPEEIAIHTRDMGGFVSGLDLTETADQIVERAVQRIRAAKPEATRHTCSAMWQEDGECDPECPAHQAVLDK